jgi:hypothetical protein
MVDSETPEKVWKESEWTPEADMLSQIADNSDETNKQLTRIADLLEGIATAAGEYLAKLPTT